MNMQTFKLSSFILILFFQSLATHTIAAYPQPIKSEQVEAHKRVDPPKKNKLALWSLLLSAGGLVLMLFPYLSIASPYLLVGGVVSGILALSKIKKTKEKGKGLAIAGLIIGGVSILAIIAAVAVLLSIFG